MYTMRLIAFQGVCVSVVVISQFPKRAMSPEKIRFIYIALTSPTCISCPSVTFLVQMPFEISYSENCNFRRTPT